MANKTKLAPHELRVIEEREELGIKLKGLEQFLVVPGKQAAIFNGLPKEDQELLKEQFKVMSDYWNILNARIARFNG